MAGPYASHQAETTPVPRIVWLERVLNGMAAGDYAVHVPTTNSAASLIGQAVKRLAQALTEREERTLRLLRLSEGIHSAMTVEEALESLYYSVREVVPFDRLGCALLTEDQKTARAVWARSNTTVQTIYPGYAAPIAGSSLATVLQTGEPRVLNDLDAYLEAHPSSESTRLIVSEGMRSSLTCPIFNRRRPVGFLFFSSTVREAYRREHVEFYQQISRVVGSVLERARLYEDLRRTKNELEEANIKLRSLADLDALTLIPNRRAFDQRLELEWRRAQRSALPLTLLMVDVDDFKAFNDRYGHLAGDQCLRRVAEALAGSLRRAGEFVARFGGEEFAIVLPGTDDKQAGVAAERCLNAVRALHIPHERARSAPIVTLSIGYATWDGVSKADRTELLAQADTALYQAKNNGRNTSSVAPGPVGTEQPIQCRRV